MVLTTFPYDPVLDLAPWVGQRQASFRFLLQNRVTGVEKGEIHPIQGASLTHDTTRVIKRQLNMSLGVADMNLVDPVTDLVRLYMIFPTGASYPLGQYMFTDSSRTKWTSGRLGNMALTDEMFIVDQPIEVGINGTGGAIDALKKTLIDLPINVAIEASGLTIFGSWSLGTNRGSVIDAIALAGDWFSPWFDNNGIMRFIRSFDPADKIADFDFDSSNRVIRQPILETDDLLTAPNRFIVISNSPADARNTTVSATADVSPRAPHSIANRGFVLPAVFNLQTPTDITATAMARNLRNRQTVFERVELTTPPDPRHDSYNVIKWNGSLWLELAWSMALVEGGVMNHLLRKAYPL